jgi:hypothetical protein
LIVAELSGFGSVNFATIRAIIALVRNPHIFVVIGIQSPVLVITGPNPSTPNSKIHSGENKSNQGQEMIIPSLRG